MITPRSVIVGLRSGSEIHAAWGTATEFARLFGISVRGCVFEEQPFPELCDLPAGFLPRPLKSRERASQHRMMATAIAHETHRIRAMLAALYREAGMTTDPAVPSGDLPDPVAMSVGPGDLLVIPLDLSDRPIGRQIAANVQLYPMAGGLLFVPNVHPGRAGDVIGVTEQGSDRAAATAIRIASGLGAPAVLAMAEAAPQPRPAEAGTDVRKVLLQAGSRLDATVIAPSVARLIVCEAGSLERVELDGPRSALLGSRGSLLVLGRDSDPS